MAPGIASPALAMTATGTENQHAQKAKGGPKATPQLLHHRLVTTDFDELKFRAAASLQLQLNQNKTTADKNAARTETETETDTRLIASPYNEPAHLLDLETLDTQNRLLAQALAAFKPIRDDYATAPYTESFNWDEVFRLVRDFAAAEGHVWTAQSFYVVEFRSKLHPDADPQKLHALDAHSHQEAIASGGLLKYWFGSKNEERRNLATCVWRSRQDARLGGRGPWHARARMAARELYEQITFTTLKLVVGVGAESWSVSAWQDDAE